MRLALSKNLSAILIAGALTLFWAPKHWFPPIGHLTLPTLEQPSTLPTFEDAVRLMEHPELLALLSSGGIRPATAKEVDAWNRGAGKPFRTLLQPRFKFNEKFDYVITRQIELPDGLHGAWSKNFLVAAGVPPPGGDAGHGCVALMDGFKVVDRDNCFQENRSESLELFEATDIVDPACRLFDPPASATVLAVTGYATAAWNKNPRRGHVPGDVAVHVTKPGDVVLVLSMYEPAFWTITAGPKTRITGVVLGGYHDSEVIGLNSDIPVVHAAIKARPDVSTTSGSCKTSKRIEASPTTEGPDLGSLEREVRRALGRPLQGWASVDGKERVEIR